MEEKNILPADVYKTLPDELKAKAGALAKVYSTLFTGEVYEKLYTAIREGKTVKEFAQEAQHILDKYGSSEKLKVYTGEKNPMNGSTASCHECPYCRTQYWWES